MNIIEKFSIGGIAFALTPEAKTTLQAYLKEIRRFYFERESGSEIVAGIEDRIAELLQEKCGSERVVSKEDIDEVIKIMGYPEDIEEPEKEGSAKDDTKEKKSGVKRLYRDPKNGVIAGVCSGFASYFGVDVVLVRLIFVALFAMSFWPGDGVVLTMPLIYLVLIIAMPAAKTAQERWAIKGDDGGVDGVERIVKNGVDAIKTASRSQFWSVFGRACAYCIGIVMIIVGVVGLVALAVGAITGPTWFYMSDIWQDLTEDWPGLIAFFSNTWTTILILIVFAIPFFGLLWGGIQLCFNLPNPKWRPGLILFIIWLIAIVILATLFALSFLPLHYV